MEFRKGQLSIGFYTALILFIGVLGYLTYQLFQLVPVTTNAIRFETTRIEAYQISEMLVDDGGYPIDWNTHQLPDIKRLGLSDTMQNKTNLISSAKATSFNTICTNNYRDVQNLLDIQNQFSITFIDHTSGVNWICKSPDVTSNSFNITRIVSIDGTDTGEITVQVWQK